MKASITIDIEGPDANVVSEWQEKLDALVQKATGKLISESEINTLITVTITPVYAS